MVADPDLVGLGSVPAASVIIPAYNAEATLREQLEALLAQDASVRFEVLVCDNGSTDGTAQIVHAMHQQIPTIRLVDASARRGASAARNIGAGRAQAPVLLFCDADDVVDSGWVRIMVPAVEQHGFVAGLMEHALLNPRSPWDGGWVEPTYREGFLPWLPAVGSGNMGVRADVFASVGGFDETRPSGEDADLSWRLQLAGHQVYSAWDAVVHVRKREGLRATIRQSFAKGKAVRQLEHDYALVARAFADTAAQNGRLQSGGGMLGDSVTPDPGVISGTARSARFGRLRRMPVRGLRIARHPSQFLRECGELSSWLGFRFGRIDRSRDQIVPGEIRRM